MSWKISVFGIVQSYVCDNLMRKPDSRSGCMRALHAYIEGEGKEVIR